MLPGAGSFAVQHMRRGVPDTSGIRSLPLGARDGDGQLHRAFAVPASELETWETLLAQHSVTIEQRRTWVPLRTQPVFPRPDRHLK